MVSVSGPLKIMTDKPSRVSEVWVGSPRTRPHGVGLLVEERDKVTPVGGVLSFTSVPGPVLLTLVSGGRVVDSVRGIVPDKPAATLAEVVRAAGLADAGTLSQLEQLSVEVAAYAARVGTAAQVETWAEQASSAASAATYISNQLPTRIDELVPPKVAEVIGSDTIIRDAAAAAVVDAVDAAMPTKADQVDVDQLQSEMLTAQTRLKPDILTASDDLNTLTTPRRYRTVSGSIAENASLHYPPGATHGWLDVIQMGTTYFWQVWVDTWNNFVASRRLYAGSWTEWARLGAAEAQVSSGSAVVASLTRPDYWAAPAGDGIFWQGTDHTEYISPDYRGEGYVGRIGKITRYSLMQVEKTTYGDIYVSCINSNSKRHVTYLVETGNVAGARRDDFAIVADTWVGAYTGGAAQRDTLVARRSNREWAVQIDHAGSRQWVPHHGIPTAVAAGPRRITDSTGAPIDLDGMSTGQKITVHGIKIHQPLYARHPDTGTTNHARIEQTTTIAPDGLLQSETTMTALQDFTMYWNYGPMTMMEMGTVNQFHVLGGGSYSLASTPPTTTVYQEIGEGQAFTSGLATGEDIFVAVGLLDPERMWMSGRPMETTDVTPLRIENRSSGMLKVYPSPVETGALIPAGMTWSFGAQWRYGETTNPAQYA